MMVEDTGYLIIPAVGLTAMVIIVMIPGGSRHLHGEGRRCSGATATSQTGTTGVEAEVHQDAGEFRVRIGLVHVFAVKGSFWRSWSARRTAETGAAHLLHVEAPGVQTRRTVIERESDLKGDCLRNHQIILPLRFCLATAGGVTTSR